MIKELKETKDWIARNRNNRIIRLTGSRRNSTAMAIGHTFSAVSGFNIEMEHRGDFWKTIHYPTSSTPDYPISINYKAGRTKKLVVVVSIMKVNVPKDVLTFLESTEDIDNSILEVTSELPIVSSDQANIAVHKIKEEIKKTCSKINVSEIYFFYAGPSHLSLYLGYRWNAIPKTRCYEWVGPANYVQTVTLE